MEKKFESVSQFHGEDILMSIKTEPEVIFERDDNANSTTEYSHEEDNELPNIAPKKAKSCCRSCIDFKSYIDDLFEKQSEKIREQNVEIMQALEVQKDLTIRLLLHQQTAVDLKSSFPLASQEALIDFDKQINKDNKHLYVNTMKELIRNNLFKNMDQIITEDLIYNYNVDGSHGKKGLKDLNNFYTAFKSAVGASSEIEDVEAHIRKAVNLIKKRYLKKLLKDKKCDNRETNNLL